MIQMRYFTAGTSLVDVRENNLLTGRLPRRIFFGLVANSAFHGDFNRDPFNFQHFDATKTTVVANGSCDPYQAVDTDFEDTRARRYKLALAHFLEVARGLHESNFALGINSRNYFRRNVLYGFDLSPSGPLDTSMDTFEDMGTGKLDVCIKLKGPPATSVTLVMLAEYDGEIKIYGDKRVTITNLKPCEL